MKEKLIKREYIGEGFIHRFRHIKTGQEYLMPFTKELSLKISGEGGVSFVPPAPIGYRWEGASSGTVMVDSPTTILGDKEFTIIGDTYLVAFKNEFNSVSITELSKVEFDEKYETEI